MALVKRLSLVAVVAVLAQGCTDAGPARWTQTLVPVDSGLGSAANLYTTVSGSGQRLKFPRFSWSADGSALIVAGIGPRLTSPATESSLWAISPPSASVTTVFTWPGGDEFVGAICYTGTTDCDIVRFTGRILRRKANGDTVPILKVAGGFFTSANGRFILHNPTYNQFPAGGSRMELFDVVSGTGSSTNVADVSGTYGVARPVAVSDDGREVDAVGTDGFTITRYRLDDPSLTTTWSIAKPDGWTTGHVRDLRWVGATLHVLVQWTNAEQIQLVQYVADGGPTVVLGTTKPGVRGPLASVAWRPELQRAVVATQSGCDVDVNYNPDYCLVSQFELELMRGGVTTRIARSHESFMSLVMSPDGRWLGYGYERFAIKSLPE